MLESLETHYWLEKFLAFCKATPGLISNSTYVGPANATTHFVVGAAVHGNEVGAIPAFVHFLKNADLSQLRSRITLFIGNYDAILANQRFIQHDLNRIIVPSTGTTKEHLRAQEIRSLLDTADYFLDLHQTIQPTSKPFYVFLEDAMTMSFARFIQGSELCVVGHALPAGQMSTEQYMQSRGKPGATLELGHMGINQESFDVAQNALNQLSKLAEHSEVQNLQKIAELKPALRQIKIEYQHKFTNAGDKLLPGLKNLDPVRTEQHLGHFTNGEKILAPMNGLICFPKYPKRDDSHLAIGALPNHLFEIAVEI